MPFRLLVYLDTFWVKLEGQCHRSKFKVTGGKQEPATDEDSRPWLKIKSELEIVIN